MAKNFGFLLFDQFEDLDFFGPWEIVGVWRQQFAGPELFTISEQGQAVTSTKGLTLTPRTNFIDCPALDFLLVPGGMGTRREVHNERLIQFIGQQYRVCEQMLSVCTGAFLLQAAGLLEGKRATTHIASLDRLAEFENVTVCNNERFVQDGNIWTSAGISAGMDMVFAFIAQIAGEETAGNIQNHTEYYPSTQIFKCNQPLPGYVKQK